MERFRRNKGPLLLPVLCLAAALGLYLAITALWGTASVARQLSLGQQYLTDMNYSAAILAFNNAIRTDPCSKQAHLGLARAYAGAGDYAFASSMLEDLNQGPMPDVEISEELIQIYTDAGQWERVIRLIRQLIAATDQDEYYDLLDQVLADYFDRPHSVAEGTDQRLWIRDGRVWASGSNTLGQLGVAEGLGVNGAGSDRVDAGFEGAARVFCAGRTSLVLDEAGDLWAAGENRWGQMGLAYADGAPRSGWTRITSEGNVAAAAGTTGHLLVLRTDGTLWQAGSMTGGQLLPVERFPAVIQLEAGPGDSASCLLTADGALYANTQGEPEGWTLVDGDVLRFGAGRSGLVWLSADGGLESNGLSLGLPDGWTQLESGGVQPDFAVRDLAQAGGGLLLTDGDGGLYRLENGQCRPVATDSPVENLYRQGDGAVLELRNGGLLFWGDNAGEAAALA